MKRSLISHKVLGRHNPRGGVSGIKIFEEEVNFVAKLCEGTRTDHDYAGHLYLINWCPSICQEMQRAVLGTGGKDSFPDSVLSSHDKY